MAQKPRILNRRPLAATRIFQVEGLELEFPNGVRREYERLLGSPEGAVLIVPLLDAETVLLIREYAAGTDRYELAFPKGRIEAGEDALTSANRELQEETGYAARRLERLATVTLAPAYLGHLTHIVLATGLYPQHLPGDEPEPIEVIPWQLSRFDALLTQTDFTEARSIAALYMLREHLQNHTP